MGYFKEADVEQAQVAVRAWVKGFPEAATWLAQTWKLHVGTAGHKTMGRVLLEVASGKEAKDDTPSDPHA